MNGALANLGLEFKKLRITYLMLICLGFSAVPFLITQGFLYFHREELTGQPLAIITANNLGSWSALLYPLFIIVLTQSLVDVERKGNLLLYGRSYRCRWLGFIIGKVMVVLTALVVVTLLNTVFHVALIYSLADRMMASDVPGMLRADMLDFIRIALAIIPLVFFHLVIALLIERSGIAYLVGILLLVTGIPIINLTDLVGNPYAFGIASLKPSLGLEALLFPGTIIILLSLLISNWTLRR
ncbi:MAG: hypothetical protein WA952_17760 [Lewinella sp.]